MTRGLTESVVEDAALDWLEKLGWAVKHGLDIAPGELFAERVDYGKVVLEQGCRTPSYGSIQRFLLKQLKMPSASLPNPKGQHWRCAIVLSTVCS